VSLTHTNQRALDAVQNLPGGVPLRLTIITREGASVGQFNGNLDHLVPGLEECGLQWRHLLAFYGNECKRNVNKMSPSEFCAKNRDPKALRNLKIYRAHHWYFCAQFCNPEYKLMVYENYQVGITEHGKRILQQYPPSDLIWHPLCPEKAGDIELPKKFPVYIHNTVRCLAKKSCPGGQDQFCFQSYIWHEDKWMSEKQILSNALWPQLLDARRQYYSKMMPLSKLARNKKALINVSWITTVQEVHTEEEEVDEIEEVEEEVGVHTVEAAQIKKNKRRPQKQKKNQKNNFSTKEATDSSTIFSYPTTYKKTSHRRNVFSKAPSTSFGPSG